MYCRHSKENRIQLSKYKDCNGGLQPLQHTKNMVVVVLRSPIHANEPSEYNGMLYRTSNRVLNNGIKVIILICMDGTSQYHHYQEYHSVYKLMSEKYLSYEGHSVNSEIRCVSAIAYLLAESWCCLCKAPAFISHNTKETIS